MYAGSGKVSVAEKLAYGLGDAAANIVFQLQVTFLLYFYTDVFGIAAGTAGLILLVSRLADALYGIVVGAIADQTHSRWGQYRIWVLAASAPLASGLVLCFAAPPLGEWGRIAWATTTYNLLMIAYVAHNIPYCALAGVMTDDSNERTSLASWRFICAMTMALIVNTFTLDFVHWLGGEDTARGFIAAAIVWGLVAVAMSVVTFAGTVERISAPPKQQTALRQDLIDLFRNRPWFVLFALAVIVYVQLALRSGTLLHYFKHYMQRESLFGAFNGVGLGVTLVGVMLSQPLSVRFGKKQLFCGCLLVTALFMGLMAIVPSDKPWLLFVLQIPLQLAFGPTIPLLWSMMADVIDFSEWTTGRRSTALAFGSLVFGLKLGFSVGGWLGGELLAYFGYAAGGIASASTANGIRWMISVLPAALLVVGAGVLYWYPLDDRVAREIESALRERRAENGPDGAH